MEIEIKIPTDEDGYFSLECPYCNGKFKVSADDIDLEEAYELFCPYCGLIDEINNFLSNDVIEHAQTIALNYMIQQINKEMKDISRKFKGSGYTFQYKKLKEELPKQLSEEENLEPVNLACCNKTIKIQVGLTKGNIYCPFCGVN